MAEYSPLSSPVAAPGARRARLIPGWSAAWRLWSVRLAALGATLMTTWSSLPDGLRDRLPYSDQVAACLFVAITIARLVAQENSVEIHATGENAA